MLTRYFTIEDLPEVNRWLAAQSCTALESDSIPPCGIICEGLAVGFAVQTDSNVVYLECFVTNPGASSAERDAGLREVIVGLWGERPKWRAKRVVVVSSDAGIIRRALELGFTQTKAAAVLIGGI